MEGEGELSVQAVQSHICTRWTCLLGGWTSSFSASLDGCAEGSVFMDPHGPTIAPRCPTTVIADKIKHIYFQKESKYLFLPTISVMPLCSQSALPFQNLATRAEAWHAIPGVSTWAMNTVKRDYTLQFDQFGFDIAQDSPSQPLRLLGAQGQFCQEHTATQPTSFVPGHSR